MQAKKRFPARPASAKISSPSSEAAARKLSETSGLLPTFMLPPTDPPEIKYPDPWLMDSEALLGELTRLRELALRVPVHNDTVQPIQSVIDAAWRLESRLRYMLHLYLDGQRAFRKKAEQEAAKQQATAAEHNAKSCPKTTAALHEPARKEAISLCSSLGGMVSLPRVPRALSYRQRGKRFLQGARDVFSFISTR